MEKEPNGSGPELNQEGLLSPFIVRTTGFPLETLRDPLVQKKSQSWSRESMRTLWLKQLGSEVGSHLSLLFLHLGFPFSKQNVLPGRGHPWGLWF